MSLSNSFWIRERSFSSLVAASSESFAAIEVKLVSFYSSTESRVEPKEPVDSIAPCTSISITVPKIIPKVAPPIATRRSFILDLTLASSLAVWVASFVLGGVVATTSCESGLEFSGDTSVASL
ncbi:hypothetical protein [Candidatus Pelagisphaera phototrophica]|uniref:hypothetical protein n=1 Tax=Candidatus Pelagisphaera phototrophica TaxID=2684113 RepID=UPI0024B6E2CA|nr:hypothetical protein [Candidatus Pelagisphaera phototrophica]QXD30697.1 hypothetical protein GA004_09970 [Candidatus Pelagisphaera phototrophica]